MKGPSETKMLKKLLHYVIMGDIMSPENQGVFQLLKEVTLRQLCHSSTASILDNFARHSWAFSDFSSQIVAI
jgi:hypothetical protein